MTEISALTYVALGVVKYLAHRGPPFTMGVHNIARHATAETCRKMG